MNGLGDLIIQINRIANICRWKNVLIVSLTFWAIYLTLNLNLSSEQFLFECLNYFQINAILMIVLIAGNIINDYFDIETDRINKKDKFWIDGKKTSKVLYYYYGILIFGLLWISKLSFEAHRMDLVVYYLLFSLVLFLYSKYLKGTTVFGNLTVAFMSSLVLLMPFVIDNREVQSINKINLQNIQSLYIFTAFAFIISWIRELVKDVEDMPGDKLSQYVTFPIRYGLKITRTYLLVLFIIYGILVLFSFYYLTVFDQFTKALAFFLFICIPWLYSIYFAIGKKQINWNKLSQYCKLNMLFGLVFVLIFKFL